MIARGTNDGNTAAELPLIRSAPLEPAESAPAAWISEALQDLYGYKIGDALEIPLAGRTHKFLIAGVWRDYARLSGSVAVSRQAYIAATGDETANEGSLWLNTGADPDAATRMLRQVQWVTAMRWRSPRAARCTSDRCRFSIAPLPLPMCTRSHCSHHRTHRGKFRGQLNCPRPPRGVRHAETRVQACCAGRSSACWPMREF